MNYFSKLEDLGNTNGPLKNGDISGISNNDHQQENSTISSHNNYGHRQINTIQMVRPIPKFTTFGTVTQTPENSKMDYFHSNGYYGSQDVSLQKGLHSGSEEDLHRALPIYLPSEGESNSSLSCTSINDIQVNHNNNNNNNNLVKHFNNVNDMNSVNDDPMCYRQQLIDATQRQLSQFRPNISNESSLRISDLPQQSTTTTSSSTTTSCLFSNVDREDLNYLQYNKPPPLPARLHPPSTIHHQQQSTSPLTFFPPVIHQFPGRSVKPMRKILNMYIYAVKW